MRGVKGGDCQRKTLQPCVRLMHLWRKRIVDPLEFEKRKKKCIHTKTRIRTHRLSAVGITTLSVCWLIHYSASPLSLSLSASVCQVCLQPVQGWTRLTAVVAMIGQQLIWRRITEIHKHLPSTQNASWVACNCTRLRTFQSIDPVWILTVAMTILLADEVKKQNKGLVWHLFNMIDWYRIHRGDTSETPPTEFRETFLNTLPKSMKHIVVLPLTLKYPWDDKGLQPRPGQKQHFSSWLWGWTTRWSLLSSTLM